MLPRKPGRAYGELTCFLTESDRQVNSTHADTGLPVGMSRDGEAFPGLPPLRRPHAQRREAFV